MSTINPAWRLKYTINTIRRFATQKVDEYTIERLRAEFKYANSVIDELEKELKKKELKNEQ